MEKKFRLINLSFSAAMAIMISNAGICAEVPVKQIKKPVAAAAVDYKSYQTVDPLELVAKPQNYLNKKIKITAVFDKFSTIGLDYKPVNKSSKDYISFMIKRPDAAGKDYSIPLSELKLIIKRDTAEKLIDLESGDKIELVGTVISTALNDPWVEVDEVKVLTQKEKPGKKAENGVDFFDY